MSFYAKKSNQSTDDKILYEPMWGILGLSTVLGFKWEFSL